MAASFKVDGDNVTISFEWTQPTVLVQEFVESGAEALWKDKFDIEGNITNPFSEVTNQEKLNILYKYAEALLVNLVNSYESNKAQKEARELAAQNAKVLE